jgi:hypothetical protein
MGQPALPFIGLSWVYGPTIWLVRQNCWAQQIGFRLVSNKGAQYKKKSDCQEIIKALKMECRPSYLSVLNEIKSRRDSMVDFFFEQRVAPETLNFHSAHIQITSS